MYQYGWNACSIKSINAKKLENYVIDQPKDYFRHEELIRDSIRKINMDEKERTRVLIEKETRNELQEVEKQLICFTFLP
jgi:hypothetical protein